MAGRTYTIPESIWRECIYIIRDYDRARAEYDGLLDQSATSLSGMPKAEAPGSPTERAAIERALMAIKLNAVDEAFAKAPPEYSKAIRENIVRRTDYPDYAHRVTFVRWKARIVRHLAEKLLMI